MKKQCLLVSLAVILLIVACSTADKTAAKEKWQPIPANKFSQLITQYTIDSAKNYEMETVPFQHPVTGEKGQAVIARKSRTGKRLSDIFSEIIASETLLTKAGWQTDVTLAADGPEGTQAGYRFENLLLIFRTAIEPAAGVVIPEDEPLDLSRLSPQQLKYTVEITGVLERKK